jgi:hypothetical protein
VRKGANHSSDNQHNYAVAPCAHTCRVARTVSPCDTSVPRAHGRRSALFSPNDAEVALFAHPTAMEHVAMRRV